MVTRYHNNTIWRHNSSTMATINRKYTWLPFLLLPPSWYSSWGTENYLHSFCTKCVRLECSFNIQWNLWWETTMMRDWPLKRNFSNNMALHFYTLVPPMKDHLSYKTTFCGHVGWSYRRFHCIAAYSHSAGYSLHAVYITICCLSLQSTHSRSSSGPPIQMDSSTESGNVSWAEWESVTIDVTQWTVLIKQLEDLLALQCLIKMKPAKTEEVPKPTIDMEPIKVSVKKVLDGGRGMSFTAQVVYSTVVIYSFMIFLGTVHNCQHLNESTKHALSQTPSELKKYTYQHFSNG